MNKNFTTIAFFLLIILCSMNISAQPGVGISFRFNSTAGAPPAFVAGTNQAVPAANQDDFGYLFAPVGMNVKFAGVTYTKIVVSTNGWVALVPASVVAIPASLSAGGYLSANSLSTYSGGYPIIAPYWDDIATTLVSYSWSAGALWVRWSTKIDKTNAAAAINFYIRVDGTTGVVNMYYNTNVYTISGTPSASIGVAGVCTGDYYSYNFPAAATFADSTLETNTIATRPSSLSLTFTPYQLYDNCANAKDLSPLTTTCTYSTYNINNAITSGSSMSCSPGGTDVADIWFKVVKPASVLNFVVTTASASPACQSVSGTTVQVYTACGTPIAGACSSTSVANPNFGELTLSRPCIVETLYVRVTNDGDIGGKFNICVKDGGPGAPGGNTCSNPNWICTIPYNQSGLTTAGFGAEYDSANSSCHDPFMNGEDYVFAYMATSNICLRIAVNSTGLNPGVFVFDGCPDQLGTTHCIASSVNTTGSCLINSVSLSAGTTYYFLIDNNPLGAANTNIPFDINITQVGTAQAYDACGAVSLGNIGSTQACTWSTYTTECAVPSAIVYPAPGCGSYTTAVTGDIWVSFTATFNGSLLLNTQPGAVNPTSDLAMAVYSGNCIILNLIACDDNSAGSGMPQLSITVSNLTTYYIRLWTVAPGNTGNFDLCLTASCSPPNDLPCSAVLVNLGGIVTGTNTCAASASEPPNPAQCVVGGVINTVWYKAVVPASGSLKIRTHTHTLSDTQIQAYTFPTTCANAASSYVSRGCNDDGPDCGSNGPQSYHDFSELSLTGLTPGDTVFVAVDGYNSQTGTFEITIMDGANAAYPPITGADCDAAIAVCGPSPITVDDPGILGYGNICDFPVSSNCWPIGERNSAWYSVTVNPGTLQFDIQTFSDYDFLMWDVTGVSNACAQILNNTLTSVACNYTTTVSGHTGIMTSPPNGDWENAVTVSATPHTYLLLIDNWNPPFQTTGYTIDWMGSPISSTTTSVTWQGVLDTSFANITNWGTPPCNAVPTCGIDAIIAAAPSGRNPTISANMSVRNLTINAGGTLRIRAPFILDVCGNFTNNGTLICEPGSTVRFSGTANTNQTVNGTLTGANGFANLTITKPAASGSVLLNSNIDVKGNFLTSSGTSIFNINGKYMKVTGNFTNFNGVTTFTGIGNSTVEFIGSLNQFFVNNNGSILLNRVRMNKTNGRLYLNGINSSMNIDSALTLTWGQIVTRSLPSLEVNMKYYLPASITGQNAASFIDGKLRRKISNGVFSSPPIPASYDFPLGDSTLVLGYRYELANITFTTPTLVFDLLGTFNGWTAAPPAAGPVASECFIATYSNKPIFDNGYWTFKRSTATNSGNYRISLYNTGFTNNTGLGWTVAKADTILDPNLITSWKLLGNCVLTSTPANTQRTNINPSPVQDSTSFNHYYATVQTEFILPIELLYFSAEPYGEDVLCKWETASETNNEYFNVERSSDGIEYISIGSVRGYGAGTSSISRKYSFTDHEKCEGIRYYRLKQVDIDGQFSYSDPVAINCKRISGIELYPNPANSVITYKFSQTENCILTVSIFDIAGRIIKTEEIDVQKGINLVSRNIDELAAGVYYLRLFDAIDGNVKLQTQFFKN